MPVSRKCRVKSPIKVPRWSMGVFSLLFFSVHLILSCELQVALIAI